MYVCGMTVYDIAISDMQRVMVVFDMV